MSSGSARQSALWLVGYLKAKSASCVVPSSKPTVSARHVSFQAAFVFQTHAYVSLATSYSRPLLATGTAGITGSPGGPLCQAIGREVGADGRIPSPRSPPRLNLIGTAWPALTGLTSSGGLARGALNPVNGYTTV